MQSRNNDYGVGDGGVDGSGDGDDSRDERPKNYAEFNLRGVASFAGPAQALRSNAGRVERVNHVCDPNQPSLQYLRGV